MHEHFLRNLKVIKKYDVNITQNAQEDLEYIYDYISSDNINAATNFILEFYIIFQFVQLRKIL